MYAMFFFQNEVDLYRIFYTCICICIDNSKMQYQGISAIFIIKYIQTSNVSDTLAWK